MKVQTRGYDAVFREQLARQRQMVFVSGPPQVGKTTTCRQLATGYLNWDSVSDRRVIARGPQAVAKHLGLGRLREPSPVIVFDELHKSCGWTSFLKSFFDEYGPHARVIVTGSSAFDIARRGGHSLMGRYFTFRMHPWSVAECAGVTPAATAPIRTPVRIGDEQWHALLDHGGFPEPFLMRDSRFTTRWQALRQEQLTTQDLRDVAHMPALAAMETLALILAERSAQQLVYGNLSREVGIPVDTARRWVDLLVRLHHGFLVRPWFRNVANSLRKEPKWYLRDWSGIEDVGARTETLLACHLLKAVEGWTDLGFGQFELRYLRDQQGREVDFLVVRNRKPWVLLEAKNGETRLSDALGYFQRRIQAEHAFQVVMEKPFENDDCFAHAVPIRVSARTFLSQLM